MTLSAKCLRCKNIQKRKKNHGESDGMRCNKRRARKVFHRIASRLPCEATAGPSCRRRRRGFERQPPCFTVPRYTTTPRLRHPFNSFDVFTDGDGVGQQTVRCCVWVGCGSATRCLCWCFDVGTSRLVGLRGQVSQPLFSDRGVFGVPSGMPGPFNSNAVPPSKTQ